jgi:hypothetical protein
MEAIMEEKRLGCKVGELEVGTEFSMNEGRSWWVVRTEPKYLAEAPEETRLRFMIAPRHSTGLSQWEEYIADENEHVLLEPDWKG